MDIKTESYIRELENLQKQISLIDDVEVKSSLVKLLCVRTSGLLEVFLKTRISEYSKGKVPKEINHFLTQKFKDITNLKSTKFNDVLASFSSEWSSAYMTFLNENEQIKSSLDSIIAQRHSIAHGQRCGIAARSMLQYYGDILSLVRFLECIIR